MNKEIEILRRSVRSFFYNKILPQTENKKVLEIGPAIKKYTPIPELFVDTKRELLQLGNEYYSCDIDPDSEADYICDFLEIEKFGLLEEFDVIIALEVLEHTTKVWDVPGVFRRLLKPSGMVYVSTPFYFLWHDPKPDLWRLSRDGLKFLFESGFDVEIESTSDTEDDGTHPIHHTLVGKKREWI